MSQHFRTKTKEPTPGFDVMTLLRKKLTKGAVGLEIEVEGKNLPKSETQLAPFWSYHKDNSLRGIDNAEYVLTKPIEFDRVEEAIKHLWDLFTLHKSTLDESNRTSVHVHLNVQKFHLNRLTSFMALYFCVEELLTAWCGEHRIGNLFCLRAKDAPGIITHIKRFIATDGKTELRDCLHYAGLNANALAKFGSIEVRTLRGATSPDVILNWIGFLERLYNLSGEFKDPRDVCGLFSSEGPTAFFEHIFGEKAFTIRQGIDYTEDRIRDAMYDGIRLAQDLCYCRDWDLYQPLDVRKDPFGRDIRKLAPGFATLASDHAQQLQDLIYTYHDQTQPVVVNMQTFNTEYPPAPPQGIEEDNEPEEYEGDYHEDYDEE